MSPSRSAPGGSAADSTPLLSLTEESSFQRGINGIGRRTALSIGRMLHRVGSRRGIDEPSMRVREAAAEHIQERQTDWGYSLPMLVFNLVCTAFVLLASIIVLYVSRDETPSRPLRPFIIVYDICQAVSMLCYWVEYLRRQNLEHLISNAIGITSDLKDLRSGNSLFNIIWWIVGIYWVASGGSTLANDAPTLYWTCIVFLSLDVFVLSIFIFLACLVGLALCCCLPFIISILHAFADQEGATTEHIQQLPRFIYKATAASDKGHGEIVESHGGMIIQGSSLRGDKAVCAVCLSEYEDKSELRQLPCSHLFHSTCIDKWLRIKPTCPLCNVSILSSGEQIGHVQA